MFKAATGFWSIAGDLTQAIFDAGTLKHRQSAAVAACDEAEAQHRVTVITAFQNVADTLHVIISDADTLHVIISDADALHASQRAEQAAKRMLDITQQQQVLGDVGSLVVVTAEQAWLSSITARANRLGDSAALLQALCRGCWKESANGHAAPGCGNCFKRTPAS